MLYSIAFLDRFNRSKLVYNSKTPNRFFSALGQPFENFNVVQMTDDWKGFNAVYHSARFWRFMWQWWWTMNKQMSNTILQLHIFQPIWYWLKCDIYRTKEGMWTEIFDLDYSSIVHSLYACVIQVLPSREDRDTSVIPDLERGKPYQFVVRSCNQAGCSPFSNPLSSEPITIPSRSFFTTMPIQ